MTDRGPVRETVLEAAEGISAEPITQWDLFVTRLRRHRLAMIASFYMTPREVYQTRIDALQQSPLWR